MNTSPSTPNQPDHTPAAPAIDPVLVLADRFTRAIAAAFPDLAPADIDPAITASKNPKFGDFQCNAAMALGKRLGKPPREIAQALVERVHIDDLAEPLTPASIAGPGFINIQLKAGTLASLLQQLDTPRLGLDPVGAGSTVVVDLCGVNLAKQMHVGHIRATFIGDALARVFERLGYAVKRQNHVGDWGLNIAMVTGKLLELKQAGRPIDALDLDAIERLYKDAQRDGSADERGLAAVHRFNLGPKALAELEEQVLGARAATARARQTLVRLQAKEPEVYAVWKQLADVTMRECLALCKRMNAVVLDEHSAGESSYANELGPMVADLEARGIAVTDQGALVVRVEGIEEPCIIRKSDGAFLYATTDVCAIRRRVQSLGAQRVVYCVDVRQSLHFQQVFAVARLAGYARLPSGQDALLQHAGFGTILGEDGRPFKTRSGESVKLADLLEEAVDRARAAIDQRAAAEPDRAGTLTDAQRAHIAEAVGIGAIKYADLSNDRAKDYVFSFDRMLAFEGNTGPYLLYALVRTKNVQREAAKRDLPLSAFEKAPLTIAAPEEKALALTLLRYPASVQSVLANLEPHRLGQFLYDLAQAYSTFYAACPVLAAPDRALMLSRLRLCRLCERTLADGLTMLGLTPLDRM